MAFSLVMSRGLLMSTVVAGDTLFGATSSSRCEYFTNEGSMLEGPLTGPKFFSS